jgi:uncharacterized membrane protein
MLDEIKFALKVLAFSILMVILLQFKVGTRTIESHVLSYAQQSRIVSFAEQAAVGAVSLVSQGVSFVIHEVKSLWGPFSKADEPEASRVHQRR